MNLWILTMDVLTLTAVHTGNETVTDIHVATRLAQAEQAWADDMITAVPVSLGWSSEVGRT
ncbi:MAG: hypothetical protein GY913_27875 [Proteobacteria bacterium]|nr:hypothetical protein [Pseudomonadota bacterium]MCP4920729.1 hypothetical protein [Pseudomonadota bacterium]